MSKCNCSHTVTVTPKVSVLSNDYSGFVNLPKINGVTLLGDSSAQQLSLLSSSANDYETVTLDSAKESDGCIIVLFPDEAQATKINLSEFIQSISSGEGTTTTAETLNENAEIGSYQYVLID